jgi:predicted RecB family nuclease
MASKYIDLGTGKWRRRWISKQDLVEYLRCKYRVFLSFSTGIPIPDMKETALLQLMLEKGLEFESGVVEDIRPREVHSREAIEPLAKETLVVQIPKIFRNHELGIQGIPDLINTEKGKFIPIEIKNHKEVTDSDELELAFYWLLLDPLRKKKIRPKGYIVLNTGEVAEVNLTKEHLWDVEFYLDDLRKLSKTEVEPVLSHECKQCKLSKDCREKVVTSGGLSIIYNVSYARERQFKDIGIDNISKLMQANEEEVNSKLIARFGNTPGVNEIFRMKCHALSISSGKPFFFGDKEQARNIAASPFLVLDLEYDVESLIWLVGVAIQTGNKITYQQYFAEKSNLDEERRILRSLIDVIERRRSYLVFTYSGISADIPQLRAAWLRQGLPGRPLSHLMEMHVDACQFVQRNFRFPMKSLGLNGMEEYLGIHRSSGISGGLEAVALYKRCVRTKDDAIKQQLLDYNREDIDSTLKVVNRIPVLVTESLTI